MAERTPPAQATPARPPARSRPTRPPRPPGPPARPLIGNLPEFAHDTLGFFTDSARRYGDVVRLRLGAREAWLLSDPALIEFVLVQRHRDFVKHSFFWRHVTRIFGQGLLTTEGGEWVKRRRLAQPAFHASRLAAYGEAMTDFADRTVDGWRAGDTLNLHPAMMQLTLRIVAKVLFDAEVEEDVARVERAFDGALREVAARFRRPFAVPDWLPTPGNLQYMRAVRELDTLVYRFIAEHRARSGAGEDLLAMLMNARDADGNALGERDVRDEAVTLLLAGHETTALVLSWAWHLIGAHPQVEQRLHGELDSVLRGRTPGMDDVRRLRWTEAIVLESMRLYPPAYTIGREAVRDLDIAGYRMPRGTTVFISAWVMHRDPRFFTDPDAFQPERWMDGLADRISPFVYLPFGGGPRRCIGHRFAMLEAVLLLATIARRVRLRPTRATAPTPFPTVTLRPDSVPARVEPR